MGENIVAIKSAKFADRMVKFYLHLTTQHQEYVMSKQILRSGTSIGANIQEALMAVSKPDFIAKLHISLKEANETIFWIDRFYQNHYINDIEHKSLLQDCNELKALLISIIKTTKRNTTKN